MGCAGATPCAACICAGPADAAGVTAFFFLGAGAVGVAAAPAGGAEPGAVGVAAAPGAAAGPVGVDGVGVLGGFFLGAAASGLGVLTTGFLGAGRGWPAPGGNAPPVAAAAGGARGGGGGGAGTPMVETLGICDVPCGSPGRMGMLPRGSADTGTSDGGWKVWLPPCCAPWPEEMAGLPSGSRLVAFRVRSWMICAQAREQDARDRSEAHESTPAAA